MKQLRLFLFILSMFDMSNMSAQIIYDYFEYTIIGDGEVELTGVENFDDWSNIGTIVFVPETIYDEDGSEYTVTAIGEGAFATTLIESIWHHFFAIVHPNIIISLCNNLIVHSIFRLGEQRHYYML